MAYNNNFPKYTSIEKMKETAKKQRDKLKKKNPNLNPIVIEGNSIATTWWGKAWNKNLENYRDFSNRIPRGRSYVRNGAVLDVQIKKGVVDALVSGSNKEPYKIKVQIKPITTKQWDSVLLLCHHKIDNLSELVNGKFPKELEEIFTLKGKGLFPTIQDIDFNCNCFDYANMCKHVAAVLYGIGARFDDDPTLFFKLRNIDFEDLLKKTIEQKMKSMLENSDKKSNRILEDENVFDLFGL